MPIEMFSKLLNFSTEYSSSDFTPSCAHPRKTVRKSVVSHSSYLMSLISKQSSEHWLCDDGHKDWTIFVPCVCVPSPSVLPVRMRIIESLTLQKTFQIIELNHQSDLLSPITKPCSGVNGGWRRKDISKIRVSLCPKGTKEVRWDVSPGNLEGT